MKNGEVGEKKRKKKTSDHFLGVIFTTTREDKLFLFLPFFSFYFLSLMSMLHAEGTVTHGQNCERPNSTIALPL